MKCTPLNISRIPIFVVVLGLLLRCSTEPGGEDNLPPVMSSDMPEEIDSLVSQDLAYEQELTNILYEMNCDMDRMYPGRIAIESWGFSYTGSVDEAMELLEKPEDAEIIEPYDIPVVGLLNYHLFMTSETAEETRGTDWESRADGKAREWEGMNQRICEFSYMREAYPEAEEKATLHEDPYVTWSFTFVSPFIDMHSLELVEGTYIVASCIQVLYPPDLE